MLAENSKFLDKVTEDESSNEAYLILYNLYASIPESDMARIHTVISCSLNSRESEKYLRELLLSYGIPYEEIYIVLNNLTHQLWRDCDKVYNNLKNPERAVEDVSNFDIPCKVEDIIGETADIKKEFNSYFPAREDKENAYICIDLIQADNMLRTGEIYYNDMLTKEQYRFLKKLSTEELMLLSEYLSKETD